MTGQAGAQDRTRHLDGVLDSPTRVLLFTGGVGTTSCAAHGGLRRAQGVMSRSQAVRPRRVAARTGTVRTMPMRK